MVLPKHYLSFCRAASSASAMSDFPAPAPNLSSAQKPRRKARAVAITDEKKIKDDGDNDEDDAKEHVQVALAPARKRCCVSGKCLESPFDTRTDFSAASRLCAETKKKWPSKEETRTLHWTCKRASDMLMRRRRTRRTMKNPASASVYYNASSSWETR